MNLLQPVATTSDRAVQASMPDATLSKTSIPTAWLAVAVPPGHNSAPHPSRPSTRHVHHLRSAGQAIARARSRARAARHPGCAIRPCPVLSHIAAECRPFLIQNVGAQRRDWVYAHASPRSAPESTHAGPCTLHAAGGRTPAHVSAGPPEALPRLRRPVDGPERTTGTGALDLLSASAARVLPVFWDAFAADATDGEGCMGEQVCGSLPVECPQFATVHAHRVCQRRRSSSAAEWRSSAECHARGRRARVRSGYAACRRRTAGRAELVMDAET
jgi:hypothetical protein